MKVLKSFIWIVGIFINFSAWAQTKPAIQFQDIAKWTFNRGTTISPNGDWFAWSHGPTEGDLKLTLRKSLDTNQYHFDIGATANSPVFSKDSRFMAIKQSAKDAEAKAARKANKPVYDKLMLLDLNNQKKITYERVRNFSFSNDNTNWIAIQFMPVEGAPRDPNAAKGTDLVLYNLHTQKSYNLGNVSEFAFNKSGDILAYIIDANGQNGNGIFIRDMKTGLISALDNDKAAYKGIRWNEVGNAFSLMKSNKNEQYKQDVTSVIGIRKLNGDASEKIVFSGIEDNSLPNGMGISANATPYWSDDLNSLYFGIAALEKKETKKADSTAKPKIEPKKEEIEKPDLIIWNWQDKSLQSQQQLQEARDKAFNYTGVYHLTTKKFIQLADSSMRSVMVGPKQLYAIGYDNSKYEFESNLNGQNYTDVYVVDLKSGQKTLLLENFYQSGAGGMSVSPDGKKLVYYKGGVFYSYNMETKATSNLTGQIKASFINAMSDSNIDKPATPNFGWTSDSKFVLIKDNYDLWKITADGKSATALTDNWKNQQLNVAGIVRLYNEDKGTDLSKDQYFRLFSNKTKQAGIGKLAAGKSKIDILMLDDHAYTDFRKAENGNHFFLAKSNFETAPTYYVAPNGNLTATKQLNTNTPLQSKYAWSSGVKLIEYVSAKGDTLQAALFLPANYQPGKAYPTITYIYERLTQDLNAYTMPAYPSGGFNKAIYTSNGYAVLMPDIKYTLNDPGVSAVDCVVPAVQAAIATGIVDAKNVAIHGHSWGGYQTSFLITQTNIFKAAAAGAPLTNMISMYSLIYWNSGSTNQSIFESSQGRLTTGYWDNWEAYTRNSPIFYIKNVKTPLLLLHNDKDGAVDYTQGIEYYNGLRRLKKPVVMITYKGENHGIAKTPNRKDYAVRMLEYFDHHLKGKPAPEWWSTGIKKVDLSAHIDARAF